MQRDFTPIQLDGDLRNDFDQLIALGIREDLSQAGDLTTFATVPVTAQGRCAIGAREAGIAAGLDCISWIIEALGFEIRVEIVGEDGAWFQQGDTLAVLTGPARQILTAERMILNVTSRLAGIATATAKYCAQIADLPARLYDTRKTTVGWRRLEKYAVRMGGGHNHRTGLYDAVLIKDNHLALGGPSPQQALTPAIAIERARQYLQQEDRATDTIIEVEVDSLEQFADALNAQPDIILVDNFSLNDLRTAVAMRQQRAAAVQLEASGGVNITTIRAIAETGVDRISCGAITHQSTWLDLGLDWLAD